MSTLLFLYGGTRTFLTKKRTAKRHLMHCFFLSTSWMPSVLRVLHFFYSIEEIFVNGDTCRRSILTPPSNALSHPNSHFLRLVSNMCVCFFFPLLSRYKYLYIYIHIYICSFFFCYSNSSKREKKVHTTDVRVVFEAVRKSMLKQLKKKKTTSSYTPFSLHEDSAFRLECSLRNAVDSALSAIVGTSNGA